VGEVRAGFGRLARPLPRTNLAPVGQSTSYWESRDGEHASGLRLDKTGLAVGGFKLAEFDAADLPGERFG
jgi:hypothetical protein